MNHQAGFSIITVIFVLVVLAGLGAVMAQLGATQHLGMAMAQDGRQAYYAARAGLEWASRQLTQGSAPNCAASSTFPVEGFNVTVTCENSHTVIEGDGQFTSYKLTSTATQASGPLGTLRRDVVMAAWVRTGGP
ncbi:MAG: pilus assembly protein MshP [Chloroflexota bacterium]